MDLFEPETRNIKGVQFSIMSPDEIRSRSVVEITKYETYEGTVFLVYISLVTDPNIYDTYLTEALAAALAADLAYAITNNATLAKNYQQTADERLREARFIDATENSLGTIESNEFTDARL